MKILKLVLAFCILSLSFLIYVPPGNVTYAYKTGILEGLKYAQGTAFDYLAPSTAYTGTNITDNTVTTVYNGTNPSLWFKLPADTNGIKTYAMRWSNGANSSNDARYKYDLYFYDSQGTEVHHQSAINNDGQYRNLGQVVDGVRFVEIRNTSNSNLIAEFLLQTDSIGLIGPDKTFQLENSSHTVNGSTTLGVALKNGDYIAYSFATPQIITKWSVDTAAATTETKIEFYDASGKVLKSISNFAERIGEVNTLSANLTGVSKVAFQNTGAQFARNFYRLDVWGLPPDTNPPTIPANVTGSTSGTTVTLNWDASTDAEGEVSYYKIYRNGSYLATVNAPSTTYNDNAAVYNTTYNYQVSAVDNSGNESGKSSVVTFTPKNTTPPPAPSGLTGKVMNGSTQLTWKAVTGTADLAGYNVYVNGSKVNATPMTGTSYTVTGLENNVTNSFYVTALNTSGYESAPSNTVYTNFDTISPMAPIGLVGIANNGYVDLKWVANTEPDLAGYNAYVDNVKNNETLIPTNAYRVVGLTNKKQYAFAVTALDTSGNESNKSDVVYVTPAKTTPPAVPRNLTAAVKDAAVQLSWTAVTDADLAGYNVYKNGTKVNTTLIKSTSYNVTGLTNGTNYTFTVSAVDLDGNESAQSTPITAKPDKAKTAPNAPAKVTVTDGDSIVTLKWPAVTGATSYKVYQNGVLIGTTNELQYDVADLTNGQKYTFTVVAANEVGDSAPSKGVSTTPRKSLFGTAKGPEVVPAVKSSVSFLGMYGIWIYLVLGILIVPALVMFIMFLLKKTKPSSTAGDKTTRSKSTKTARQPKQPRVSKSRKSRKSKQPREPKPEKPKKERAPRPKLTPEQKEERARQRRLAAAKRDKYDYLTRTGRIKERDEFVAKVGDPYQKVRPIRSARSARTSTR